MVVVEHCVHLLCCAAGLPTCHRSVMVAAVPSCHGVVCSPHDDVSHDNVALPSQAVVKLQKKGGGAPAREPVVDQDTQKAMMAWYYKKQEEQKVSNFTHGRG